MKRTTSKKSSPKTKNAPKGQTYSQAGVDIGLGSEVKKSLPEKLASTKRAGVLSQVGGFGGLFELDTKRYRRPVLVSSVDGVGTKLKVAFMLDQHDTIGEDLVNHCVNDIAVLGAEPLFFLDYLATGELQPHVFDRIVDGMTRGCAQNRCALLGGETAQMPGFYQKGEYDISGTIVGAVEKTAMIDGKRIKPGDAVVGIASNGLHTNGYSLARRIFFETLRLKPTDHVAELGHSVGEELLRVHRSYGRLIQKLLDRFNRSASTPRGWGIRGMAHITGGGLIDNIPRVLPANCDAIIKTGSWQVPPVFQLLQREGNVSAQEMRHVFNMGVGMVLIVARHVADAVRKQIQRHGHSAWPIGEIRQGQSRVVFE